MAIDIVKIEIKEPLPSEGATNTKYKIEGTIRIEGIIGAPPWVYAEVKKKDWYRPEILEETTYERGFPIPISGNFSIEWEPTKIGIYEVTLVATPAPIPLPVIGVPPVVGTSKMMKITIAEVGLKVEGFKILSYGKEGGSMVASGTVIQMNPGERLQINVEFTYAGPAWRETLYGVLYTGVEDEISGSTGTSAIDVPAATTPTKVTGSFVVIPIPNRPGETFGILMKLGNVAKDKVAGVVQILGAAAPTVTGFKIISYSKV